MKGRAAIVTGASKGMGKAIASALVQQGCYVCIVARTQSELDRTAAELGSADPGAVLAISGDVADPALPSAVVERVMDRWGRVDVLVNNAGGPPPGSFLDHDADVWTQTLAQNFLSVVAFTRAVVPVMKERKWGRIISLTSTIAKEPAPSMVLSASARAAVSAFNKAIATELAPFNITVNTVCPGAVQTERAENLIRMAAERENVPIEEIFQRSVAAIPVKRFATPSEIADVVAFLASPNASYVNGVSLMIDGGLTKSVF